jgi:hypothetical protein
MIDFKLSEEKTITKTNSVAFIPQANYTDWATATCRRNFVANLLIEGLHVVSAAEPPRQLISVI